MHILAISKIGDKSFILWRLFTSYNPRESPTVQSDDKQGRPRTLIGHNRWPVDQLDGLFKTKISTCGSEWKISLKPYDDDIISWYSRDFVSMIVMIVISVHTKACITDFAWKLHRKKIRMKIGKSHTIVVAKYASTETKLYILIWNEILEFAIVTSRPRCTRSVRPGNLLLWEKNHKITWKCIVQVLH